MSFEQAVFAWLARRQGKEPAWYSELRVESDYDRGYSELTPGEGLTCCLYFKYEGHAETYWMGSDEVAEFLNGVWKEANSGDRS